MKKTPLFLILVLVAASMLLSGCTGALPASSWPGITPAGDTVYLASAQHVYAVRLTDGGELWRYPTKAENARQFYAAPALTSNDLLIAGDYAGIVVALNTKSGVEVWRQTVGGKIIASPVVVEDTILTASSNGTLYAWDLDGKEKWTYVTEQPIWTHAVSDGRNVYITGLDHNLHAVDLASGKKIWATDLGAAAMDAPTLGQDGVLYTATLSNEVVALKATDGSVLWRKDFPNHLWTRVRAVEGSLYFGDMAGNVYAISAADGTPQWNLSVGDTDNSGVVGEPVELENGLAFATQSGKIYKIGTDQTRLGTLTVEGKLYSSPVYVPGEPARLLIGLVGGSSPMIAIDVNGTELWSFVPAK